MSLDYYYAQVKNHDEVMFYPDTEEYGSHRNMMRGEVQSVIFLTIPLGISRITRENASEFYRRFRMLYLMKGYTEEAVENTGVTLELIHQLEGLGTNASTKTPARFKKDLMAEMDDWADMVVSREVLKYQAAHADDARE